jgi:hypothetical protein
MDLFIDILIGVSMAGVLVSLGLGLFAMARGGSFNRDNGNRFMRWRVWTQAAAVGVLALSLLYKAGRP